MNGTSLSVPGRIVIGQRGVGKIGNCFGIFINSVITESPIVVTLHKVIAHSAQTCIMILPADRAGGEQNALASRSQGEEKIMVGLPFRAGIASVLALLVFTCSSHAVPVSYDEASNGDLSHSDPLALLTFDVGANTISGNFGRVGAPSTTDADSFAFIVPVGMTVIGGDVTLVDAVGNIEFGEWVIRTGTLIHTGTTQAVLHADSPGSAPIPVLSAGSYNVSMSAFNGIGGTPYTANYIFTFNVDVPEPASLSLLAMGALALCRRAR